MEREYKAINGVCITICHSVSFSNRIGEKIRPMIGSRLCSSCKYFESWRKGFVKCKY